MPKVWNKRDSNIPKDAIYVGRPTKWGNPFVIDLDGTREEVIDKYRNWLATKALTDFAVYGNVTIKTELRGKDLVCWCAPEACHADVLLEIANANDNP